MKIVDMAGRITAGETSSHKALKSFEESLEYLVTQSKFILSENEMRSLEACLKSMVGEEVNRVLTSK